MKKLIAVVIVLVAVIFFFKKPLAKVEDSQDIEQAEITQPQNRKPSVPVPNATSEVQGEKQMRSSEQEQRERYGKMGYVQDPQNPNQLMKEIVVKGQKKSVYIDVTETEFEPRMQTTEAAMEVLERKKSENPAQEIKELGTPNFNDDSSMLLGRFRDAENDLDFRIGFRDEIHPRACLISHKLKIEFPKIYDDESFKADQTGYGILKLNETQYVRMSWSIDHHRVIHGQIITLENGVSKITQTFAATEISFSKGEQLSYCE